MTPDDASLVQKSRSGDRDAFEAIVARYQSLICSVALGATGNLGTSEELAQETFISAWKSLGKLADPSKLRPWLCGIVSNLAKNHNRRHQRDPLTNAVPVEEASSAQAQGVDPSEIHMAREESELLDHTMATLPESYRTPLVLFYREGQSVDRVAELLQISSSAVKKRLERGRALLRTEIAQVVERGLLQSAPGRAFTLGVLASLPGMAGTAKAATLGAASIKGAGAVPLATTTAGLGAAGGLLGGGLGVWMSLRHARSERERQLVKTMAVWMLGVIAFFGLVVTALSIWGRHWFAGHPRRLGFALLFGLLTYLAFLMGTILWGVLRHEQIRREEGTSSAADIKDSTSPPKTIQYESKARLFGLPLICVHFRGPRDIGLARQTARGWIAIGDRAYGVLFAFGGIAMGGIAIGGLSLGVVSLGGMAAGGLAVGGLALGGWAAGGAAFGIFAFGGAAVAWKAAFGGLAIAHQFAVGGEAFAASANSPGANAFIDGHWFFQKSKHMLAPWFTWTLTAITLIPVIVSLRWRGMR